MAISDGGGDDDVSTHDVVQQVKRVLRLKLGLRVPQSFSRLGEISFPGRLFRVEWKRTLRTRLGSG